MMKKNFRIKNIQILLLCSLVLLNNSGCRKLLVVEMPPSTISADVVYANEAYATAAFMGTYTAMCRHSNFEWGGITLNSSLYADDIEPATATNVNNFHTATLLTDNTMVLNMWNEAYNTMLYINTNLGEISKSDALSQELKKLYSGECYFLRAYVNFYLTNFWGDAPLVLTPDIKTNQVIGNSGKIAIYAQIVEDLLKAQSMLTPTYPKADRSRPNAIAAAALLARVYLYLGRYNDAITQATAVLATGDYTPLPVPANTFLKASKETIWQLLPSVTAGLSFAPTPDGSTFVPVATTSVPNYTLTKNLTDAFESGDQRRTNWVSTRTVSVGGVPTTFQVPFKYKTRTASTFAAATEYYVVMRAAEQYLILAEAYFRTGNIPAAVSNLNVVRNRAGLTALVPTITSDQCRAAIEKEKRIEFFAEEGHRFLDLKRWPAVNGSGTRIDEILPVTKSTVGKFIWQSYKNLWPMPDVDIDANPNLKQNTGY